MERAEHEVAGFRRGDRRADRLQVAHFADEYDVRILAQGAADGFSEARHVVADFALGDERLGRGVVEFDRVLDRYDVHRTFLVDDVDHRGECGRLARPGRTRHENEPARLVEEFLHDRRQAELFHRQQLGRNLPQDHAVAVALLEDGYAEARPVGVRQGEVRAAVVFHFGHLAFVGRLAAEAQGVLLGQLFVRDRAEVAVDAQEGGHVGADVQVARALVDRGLQKFFERDFHLETFLSSLPSPRRPW